MKIGLTGSHSTGKTSVAALYAERYGSKLVTSISREVAKLGYPINEKATVESQALTSMARIAQQIEAGDDFISDRTPLCSMGYNLEQLAGLWSDNPAAHFWFDTMDTLTRDFMPRYDLIVYFPVTFRPIGDGIRSEDSDYQKTIDAHIRFFLNKYNLDYVVIPSGSVEYRTDYLRTMAELHSCKVR